MAVCHLLRFKLRPLLRQWTLNWSVHAEPSHKCHGGMAAAGRGRIPTNASRCYSQEPRSTSLSSLHQTPPLGFCSDLEGCATSPNLPWCAQHSSRASAVQEAAGGNSICGACDPDSDQCWRWLGHVVAPSNLSIFNSVPSNRSVASCTRAGDLRPTRIC